MTDSSSQDPARRTEELADKMLEHGLADVEHAELLQLLSQDATARDRFFDAVTLHALLREEASSGRSDALWAQLFGVRPDELTEITDRLKNAGWKDVPQPTPLRRVESRRTSRRFRTHWPAFAIAAGVVGLILCYEAWLRPQAARLFADSRRQADAAPVASANSLAITPVATLTYLNGCSWSGASAQFARLDSQVRSGDEIALHEGLAEFHLSSGVSLSIEGPAALVLTSPTSLVLQYGRITVHVPSDVTNFRMVAGGCCIACRAAEFGVQVAGGDVDIHTFSGEIEAVPALFDEGETEVEVPLPIKQEAELPAGAEFAKVMIEAKRGLELASRGDGTIVSRWHAADESQFATKLTMAGALPISRAYPDAVLKSKPLGYWRFEKVVNGRIPNELGSLAPLAISGKVNFVGKAANRAVELGRPEYEGAMYCQNEFNLPHGSDYSVEAWMKPSHVHNGGIVGLVIERPGEPKESTALYLATMNRAGKDPKTRQRLRFLHRDPPGSDSKIGTDCYSNVPYRIRRWQHIVAVKQGPEMSLYLDGVLVDKQHDESSLADHLCLIVGQLGISRCVSPYIGQLDELAIYGRALTPEEIATHFKLVGPEQQEAVEIGKKQI